MGTGNRSLLGIPRLAPRGLRFVVSHVVSTDYVRFFITAFLLFCLATSQAGLLTLDHCLCPVSGKHRAACCCKAEANTIGGCCKKADEKSKKLPSTVARPSEKKAVCCQCFMAADEAPQPSPAELPSENLLESLTSPVLVEIILPLPPPAPARVAPSGEVLRPPPPSPRRIQYCSFQL